MGIPGSANPMLLGGAAGYEIEQSLRFDGSAYLSWTPGSGANRDAWTISCWVKRNRSGVEEDIIGYDGSNQLSFDNGGDFIEFEQYYAKYQNYKVTSAGKYRDPSGWYHFVIVWDSLNSTTDDRKRLYINGERIANSSTQSPSSGYNDDVPSGKDSVFFDSSNTLYLGGISGRRLQGYIAEVHGVNGSALDATSFGEYDDNGVWRPIDYTGSHGTQGFYLKFDPSATNGIGHDHSGNGNNWSPSGFTTSGTGTDVMSDTPTTNWCTLNPLDDAGNLESNGNLDIQGDGSSFDAIRSTIAMSSGKWYAEFVINTESAASRIVAGLLAVTDSNDGTLGDTAKGYSIFESGSDVRKYNNTVSSVLQSSASLNPTDVQMIAFNADTGKLWFGKNGTWFASGDPAAGTNEAFSGLTSGPYAFAASAYNSSDTGTYNFGQRAFAYTPPTGFKALNTANLPAPDIADGSQYFNTITYSGNGSNPRSLTGVGFQPSWLWIKRRSGTNLHHLVDEVRGVGNAMASDSTLSDFGSQIGSFDSDGFTTNNNAGNAVNGSGSTYVAWSWLASNTSGSSNTAGSITSTVSANPSAGFSIVTYTGNGTNGATVGHGLGVKPKLIIEKGRGSTYNWSVQGCGELWTPATSTLFLNSTSGLNASGAYGAPTSTYFYPSVVAYANENGVANVAYCFAEVEGYSKFGSYTGNGSSDGPFVYCGFRPAWVLTKRTDSTSAWYLHDTVRNTYNVANLALSPDLSDAEVSANNNLDILSNGFKLRTSGAWMNASGGTYIFMALAENPFGGDNVSPATAR